MNLLIVDDEYLIRTSLQLYLEANGIAKSCIYQADSTDSMLKILKTTVIDVAFVDIQMPGLDGLSAIEASSHLKIETHFYVLTGYSEFEYAHRALKLHIEDYLLKPVTPSQIQVIIQKEKKYLRLKQKKKRQDYLYALHQSFNDQPIVSKKIPAALVCFSGKANSEIFQELIAYIEDLLENTFHVRFITCSFLCWEYFMIQQPLQDEKLLASLNCKIRKLPCSVLFKTTSENTPLSLQSLQAETYLMLFVPLGFHYTSLTGSTHLEKAGHHFAELLYWDGEKNYDLFCLAARKFAALVNQPNFFAEKETSTQLLSFLNFYFSDPPSQSLQLEDISSLLNLYSASHLLDPREHENQLTSIQKYIESHYQEKLSLPQLSKHFGYTPNYISSAFRRQFGLTVIQYLNQVRLSNACKLLTETAKTVQEIAELTGYADANYFARIFTQEYKCSPSVYRKKFASVPPKQSV